MWPMPTTMRMTAAEYVALPDDERWCELIDGVVVVNEPRLDHGVIAARLIAALQTWVDAGPNRGFVVPPVDVDIDEHNVFAPDISWIPRLDSARERLRGLPGICVEIRSASTWRYDLGPKLSRYQAAGLPELWLVDTAAESVIVQRRSKPGAREFDVALELRGDDELTSPQLPRFALRVANIFRGIP
jgi:Uma2 family endonuclease